MKIQIVNADNEKESAIGYLQDEEIIFGLNNQYALPFEGGQNKAAMAVETLMQGVGFSTKFSWMFSPMWNGATPPEITFKIALIAKTPAEDLIQQVQTLMDMFAVKHVAGGLLIPPGSGGVDTWERLKEFLTRVISAFGNKDYAQGLKDFMESTGPTESFRSRLVNIYIGDQERSSLKFLQMLPDRIEFKGKLPLTYNSNFAVVHLACTFKKPNLAVAGEAFMKRGGGA